MTYVDEAKGGMAEMVSPIRESEVTRSEGETSCPEGETPYSPLQRLCLRRLNRLLRLRQEQSGEINGEGLRLIDRAIYSTYCDTIGLGVGAEAQKLLHHFVASSPGQQKQE